MEGEAVTEDPRTDNLSEIELSALVALVNRENVIINGHIAQFGEMQFDPRTDAVKTLESVLHRRRVIPANVP